MTERLTAREVREEQFREKLLAMTTDELIGLVEEINKYEGSGQLFENMKKADLVAAAKAQRFDLVDLEESLSEDLGRVKIEREELIERLDTQNDTIIELKAKVNSLAQQLHDFNQLREDHRQLKIRHRDYQLEAKLEVIDAFNKGYKLMEVASKILSDHLTH
jgi:hypothetical protein